MASSFIFLFGLFQLLSNILRLADIDTNPGLLQLATMVAAMTCVECGCPPSAVPVGSLNTGFVFALGRDPDLTTD